MITAQEARERQKDFRQQETVKILDSIEQYLLEGNRMNYIYWYAHIDYEVRAALEVLGYEVTQMPDTRNDVLYKVSW